MPDVEVVFVGGNNAVDDETPNGFDWALNKLDDVVGLKAKALEVVAGTPKPDIGFEKRLVLPDWFEVPKLPEIVPNP